MKFTHKFGFLTLILILLAAGCTENYKEVSLEKTEILAPGRIQPDSNTIKIAVGSMITPKRAFGYYKEMLDYIGDKLGAEIRLVDSENYIETNLMLKSGAIDAAFVCGRPYVDGHDDFGMELLAAPMVRGKTTYHSYIIVPKDSPVKSFEELRGKTFAFADPLSNSGKLIPTYMLAKMGETPNTFFSSFSYSGSHDDSIYLVSHNLVDGAAVDSIIWDYLNEREPEVTAGTRIIEISPPYGIPPFVVSPDLSQELKDKIKEILLDMDSDEQGKKILEEMRFDKFVVKEDKDYDGIRAMKRFVDKYENAD